MESREPSNHVPSLSCPKCAMCPGPNHADFHLQFLSGLERRVVIIISSLSLFPEVFCAS